LNARKGQVGLIIRNRQRSVSKSVFFHQELPFLAFSIGGVFEAAFLSMPGFSARFFAWSPGFLVFDVVAPSPSGREPQFLACPREVNCSTSTTNPFDS